jgi:hypothetical protein
MKLDNNTARLLLIGAIVLVFLGGQQSFPKEAVADVEGLACTVDTDCPCWGETSDGGVSALGIGTATCTDALVCDTTYCFDIEPWRDWARDKPWQWLKDNPMITLAILALVVLLITWPKQ